MKNNVTEIVFIIDKSGSMSGLENDTIGGINSILNKQKKESGKCIVSTVFFNGDSEVIHDRVDIDKVDLLTENDYVVGGCTALIDAIGSAIHHIGNVHKYARIEDVPEHTMFVITTDGMENSSHIYSSDKVKKMVERQKEKYGWEFVFIGANIDSVETARKFGINENRAVNYVHDVKGTHILYDAINKTVSNVRSYGRVSEDWACSLEMDVEKREKKNHKRK